MIDIEIDFKPTKTDYLYMIAASYKAMTNSRYSLKDLQRDAMKLDGIEFTESDFETFLDIKTDNLKQRLRYMLGKK